MFCENCGARIPDGARFCDQCGRPAANAPAKAVPAPPRPPDSPGVRPPPMPPPNAPPLAQPSMPRLPDPARPAAGAPPPLPKAPPAGQPPLPRPPDPARPAASAPSPAPPSPPAASRAGSLPAMPRPPQAAPTQEPPGGQGFTSPPLPGAPRGGFPLPRIDPDAAQGGGYGYVPTAPVPDVSLPQAATFVLLDTNAPLVLAGREQYVIGREDPEAGVFPDVDLTLSGGEEAGVSRKHAILSYRSGTYWLEDLDSLNYTFVNGMRLDPHQPRPLRDGDEVWFARLRTRFYLGTAAPEPWR